jgi:N-acetylglucosamine-6-sulfatase
MAPVAGQEGFVSNRPRLFELLRWMLIVLVPALPAAAQTATPIPPEFFSVSMINAKDLPAVPMGTIGHGDFAWQRIEQVKGTFDFTLFDAYVAAAQANGLVDAATNTANVAITLAAGTPGWAVADKSTCGTTNGVSVCTAPPDNFQDWKDFVTALLAHYNGTAKPHIRIYELWNEFNVSLWWTGTDAQLVALAQAAYPIVHADPNSILLTPSVAGPVGTASPHSGVTHMTSYLQAGGAAYADGGSFHGYVGAQNNVNPFPMPEDDGTAGCTPFVTCYGSIVTKATQMRAVFDQTGLLGKPMYQTEGSWGNGTVTDSNTQTAWITRFTLLQAGLHSSLNLQLAAWFTWAQPAFGWGIIEDASGNPTAAGAAYREVYHWLVGATLAQPCTGGVDGTWTCSLTRPGGYVAKAAWNTKGNATYTPGPGYAQVRDLTGPTTSIIAGASVAIGTKPVLIEGSTLAPAGAPNIVLILTDDQDVQSGMLAYMPHLQDLLVGRGTSFPNNMVPLSLCCPSRTTILRGQYPHNTGVLTNALPNGGFEKAYSENLEASTVATLLHGAGYRTVLFGKYLNGYPNTAGSLYIPPGWDEWYSPISGDPYGEFNYGLNENGKSVSYGSTPADYGTDVYLSKAVDFIQRAASTPSQPIFMYFATYAPHAPYTPAPRHAGLFPGITAPHFPSFNEADVSGKPAYISTKPLLTKADITGIDSDFRMRLQSLQAVDEAIATLVDTLSSTGRLANTYLVFAADNGYHMGEHRLLPGKYTPYETDLHVPLVVRGPGVPAGVVRNEYTADLDLAETFAELAGVPPLSFSDGRSLKPLLTSPPPSGWRQAFFLEEFGTGEFDPPDVLAGTPREPLDKQDLATVVPIPSYFGFQAPGYKYVEYKSGEKELYVASDPYELTNVASKVNPAIGASLATYLNAFDGCVGDACRAAEIAAPPALLTASFTVTPPSPPSGATVALAATATGTAPYTYAWTVDGASQSGANLSLRLSDGTHTVTLLASDGIGAAATVTKTVTVGTPPTVQIQTPAADTSVEVGVPLSFAATGSASVDGGTIAFSWDFGDGTPAASGASTSHAFGATGPFTVTLTGLDSRGSVATATRAIVATQSTLSGASLLLPVVLETPGAGGSYYTSEVTIASRLTTPVDVLLTYSASVGGGSGFARLTLAPGEQRVLPGVLGWLRSQGVPIPAGTSTRVGTLSATFSGAATTAGLFLGARTFTPDPLGGPGTFGLFYLSAPTATDTITVFGLQQNAGQRSNLALVNTSNDPIALHTVFLGPTGQQLSTVDTGLGPYGWTQLNTPLAGTGATSGLAVVTRTSGTGSYSAYGVLNDAVTSDGSFIPPLVADSSAADRLVPIVLSVAGYASELTLTNLTSSPLTLALMYKASPQLGSGSGSGTGSVTLAPHEQRIAPDALAFLRQAGIAVPTTGDAGGSLDLRASTGNASSFAVGARTFIGAPGGGTFGLFYTGLTMADSASSSAFVQGLQQNTAQRSNLAVVNRGDAGDAISLRITYYGPNGSQAGAVDTKTLAPGEWAQFNQPLASRGVLAGSAKIEKLSGTSHFVAYGVLNDQTNSDGSYIPMSLP